MASDSPFKIKDALARLLSGSFHTQFEELLSCVHHCRSKGYMKDVAISKLSEFRVEEVQSNIERLYMRIGVKFDMLDMYAKYYEVDAKMDDHLHVFGNGSMK